MMPAMDHDDHHSRNLVRTVLILLLIGIAIGVVILGLRMRTAHRARYAILPDGRTVELLGTAVGNATFTTETKWQRTARRYLPGPLQKWIPAATSGTFGSDANSLSIILSLKNPPPATLPPRPWQRVVVEDETGARYLDDGGSGSIGGPSGILVSVSTLRNYPRRQKEFLLHLLDGTGVVMASFVAPNPVTGPFPEWLALPLPQTRTNGPVALTLEGLEEVESAQYGPHTSPKWRLEATDPVWRSAKPRSHTLIDATGNGGSFLSRKEPAWKVQTLVYRELAANEQLVITNLALPAAGSFTPIDQNGIAAGVGLNVQVLVASGTLGISNGITRFMLPPWQQRNGHSETSGSGGRFETWGGNIPFLLVEARNAQPDDDIQFLVRDDEDGSWRPMRAATP